MKFSACNPNPGDRIASLLSSYYQHCDVVAGSSQLSLKDDLASTNRIIIASEILLLFLFAGAIPAKMHSFYGIIGASRR